MGYEESELCFRIGEFIFIQMMREGKITGEQFEELRDQLIDIYNPVIGELERGLPCKMRLNLK